MSRSVKKGPAVNAKLLAKVEKARNSKEKVVIKTWARSCTILPQMVGLNIGVHDGRRHVPIFITENMFGHKLGEFAITRAFRGHVTKGEKIGQVKKG